MMILRTRKEQYLNEIVGNGDTAPRTPYTREELFFADILGEVNAPAPVTRIEIYLAKIANKYSGELPEPKTRIEKFIARAAGMDVIIPTPITREEMLWANYELIVEKELNGIPPLTFDAVAGSLKNYRIYGNTVNGESVGDKTVNILPLSRTPLTEIHGDFLCEYDGLGTITLTTDKDITTAIEFFIPLMRDFTIPVSVGQGGTGCWQMNNTLNFKADIRLNYNETIVDSWGFYEVNRCHSNYISMGNKVINNILILVGEGNRQKKIVISPAFVENVTEQVPFEPYGYKIPVTLTADSAETTDIYLDEPLAKSGNNADYIDYATQKRHNSDGTESSATLPEIAVAAETNTLTIGTEVQPSNVYIKYEEARQ